MLSIVKQFCGQSRTLTIPVPLLQFLEGDHLGTLYLSQIIFWAEIMQKKGKAWFYKTDLSFAEEIYINPKSLQRLRSKFVNKGYIETKIKKLPNGDTALHYRLTDKLNQELTTFFMGEKSLVENVENLSVGNPGNRNPGSSDCPVRVPQFVQSSHIQKMSFTEDEHKKENPIFPSDSPYKDFNQTAPSGGDFALPEEQEQSKVKSKSNSASQGNREGDIDIDNHGINDNNTFTGTKSEAVISPVGAGAAAADTAAAVAWITALNDRTGSSYPPATSFIKAYDRAKKSNNLTDDQLLLVIDNAIASGLAGTWLSPNHLLRHALDFAFAAPKPQQQEKDNYIPAPPVQYQPPVKKPVKEVQFANDRPKMPLPRFIVETMEELGLLHILDEYPKAEVEEKQDTKQDTDTDNQETTHGKSNQTSFRTIGDCLPDFLKQSQLEESV